MKKETLIREWLIYSKRDFESAKYLRGLKPEPFEIICFHCQQAVEKALKAFLVHKNIKPPRTHDLDELIKLAEDERIDTFREQLIPLNDYSVIIRYPSFEELVQSDVDQAIITTESVLSKLSELLNDY